MVKKIIFSVAASLVIAFVVFLAIMNIPEKDQEVIIGQLDYVRIQEEFFTKKFEPNEKKIFIIGSSYTQALNTTEIDSKIQSKCPNCKVYNLSIQGDSIEKRSKVVDFIISSKPEMIIYGISEGDFTNIKNLEFKTPNSILPDIQNIISTEIKLSDHFYFLKIPTSPKDKTWNVIRSINKDDSINDRISPYPNSPFLKILKASTVIVSDLELRSIASNIQSQEIINEPEKNKPLKNLKDMINKIQNNKIKISLFVVPQHEYIGSTQSDEFNKSFELIKEELIDTSGITIYPRSSYSKMPIWHDLSHIAVNNQALIFSQDISDIILKELDF